MWWDQCGIFKIRFLINYACELLRVASTKWTKHLNHPQNCNCRNQDAWMNEAVAGGRHRRKSLRAEDAKISRKTTSYAVAAASTAATNGAQETTETPIWVDTLPSPPLPPPHSLKNQGITGKCILKKSFCTKRQNSIFEAHFKNPSWPYFAVPPIPQFAPFTFACHGVV